MLFNLWKVFIFIFGMFLVIYFYTSDLFPHFEFFSKKDFFQSRKATIWLKEFLLVI